MRKLIQKLDGKLIVILKLIFARKVGSTDEKISEIRLFFYSFFLLLLVSVPFFIFFYDSFNLNANIMSTYNLIFGLNPYKYGSFLVAGYMMFPYYLFLNLSYTFTDYNVEATIVLIKILATIITFFSALLIYKIAIIKNKQVARTLFFAFLFNPFIFFVNDIWVQPEFFPIFFLLLALYIYVKNYSSTQWKDSIFIMLFLIIAGWLYYFPFLLIPTFLIYSKNLRQFFQKLVSLSVVLLPSLLVVYYFHLSIRPVSAVTSNSIIPTVYSIFSIVNLSPNILVELSKISLIVMLVSAFLFPILGKTRKIPISLILLIVLSIVFVLQMNELNADSYVISIPFILLSSIGAIKKLTYSKMLLLQAFLFSQFTIVQLYNSPNGLAAGIFYWLYPYCHYNIILANEVPQIFLIHSILLVVFIVSLLVVILYFIMYKKNKKSTNSSLGKLQDKKSSFDRSPVTRISLKKNKRTILFVIFITFAILLVNINTYQIPNNNAFRSSNDFPYELFIPTFSNGYSTYVQQSPGLYSYYSANNTLFFWPQSVGIGLSRNITSQNLYLSGTFFIKDPTNQLTPPSVIVRSNNLVGGISGGVFIENNSTKLRPLYMSNIANQTLPSNYYLGLSLLHNSSIKAYSYSNYSYAEYKLSYSLVYKKSVLFGAYITKPAASQNILWRMQIDNITYESFVYDSSFISGYFFNSTWHFYTLATVKLHEWLMVGLTFNKNGSITSFVNGYQSTFPKLINQPVEIELNTGMFGNSTKYTAFSFSGIETAIFLMPSVDQNVYFITYIQDPKTNAVTTGKMNDLSDIKITFRETGNGTTTLVVGTTNVTISENAFYIAFGSISPSRLSIGYHFYSVMIKGRTTVPNYLMLVVEDSVIYPVLVLFLLCTDNRRKR